MTQNILICDANGYAAEIIIDIAFKEGSKAILAGRMLSKIEPLAKPDNLPFRVFGQYEDDLSEVTQQQGRLTLIGMVARKTSSNDAPMTLVSV
jgi:short subunit dehydrogenase-like uncharacterized protein